MKTLLKLLVLFIAITLNAQNSRGTSDISHGVKLYKGATKGHAFFLNDWVPGQLVDANGTLSETMLLNYNTHEDKLTYKNEQGDIMVIDASRFVGFLMGDHASNKSYLFARLEGSEFAQSKKVTKYYQIVSPPSRNVIVESIKKMEDPNARGWTSSSTNNKTVSFNTVRHVYVLGINQKYIRTKPTKGSILKVFKDKKKELESFILSKNIEINEAEDLDKVVGYYHSLK
jgi:hypothetical protein